MFAPYSVYTSGIQPVVAHLTNKRVTIYRWHDQPHEETEPIEDDWVVSPNAEADLGRDWTGEVRFWLQPAYCVRRRRSTKGVADADLDAEAQKRDDRSLETPSPPVVPHWSSTSLLGFQKLEFRRLQQLDPYFGPVMAGLEAELNNEDCEKAIALAIRRRQTNLEELDDMRLPSGGFWMPVARVSS